MYGVVRVVKPPGMTSHDVVAYLHRLWGVKIGHTGTLDPAAAGLLVLCVGPATRLAQYLSGCDKTYRAEIAFGISTTTYDAEGTVTRRQKANHIEAEQVEQALNEFQGPLEIEVPSYSAVHRHGERLYERARRGEKVTKSTREVQIYRWVLLDFAEGRNPRALTEIECSKGTYVRALAVQLGQRLRTRAYLSFLVRTRVGPHQLAEAFTLEQLAELTGQGVAQSTLVSPAEALDHLPSLTVAGPVARRLRHGTAQQIEPGPGQPPAQAAVLAEDEQLLCVCEVTAAGSHWHLQPATVFNWPDSVI